MGYVRTIAHHTASAARHAGDPVWIRGGNGQRFRALRVDGLGDATPATNSFDWSKLITGVVSAGADVYKGIETGQATKDAANTAAKAAAKAAAAEAAATKQQADTQLQIAKLQSQSTSTLAKSVLPWVLGGGFVLAALGMGIHFALKRKRR